MRELIARALSYGRGHLSEIAAYPELAEPLNLIAALCDPSLAEDDRITAWRDLRRHRALLLSIRGVIDIVRDREAPIASNRVDETLRMAEELGAVVNGDRLEIPLGPLVIEFGGQVARLGPFKLVIPGDQRCHPQLKPEDGARRSCGFFHPHANTDGAICWGDCVWILRLWTEGLWLEAFEFTNRMLSSFTRNGDYEPYTAIEGFIDPECQACGMTLGNASRCACCQRLICNECLIEGHCGNCTHKCGDCGETFPRLRVRRDIKCKDPVRRCIACRRRRIEEVECLQLS